MEGLKGSEEKVIGVKGSVGVVRTIEGGVRRGTENEDVVER